MRPRIAFSDPPAPIRPKAMRRRIALPTPKAFASPALPAHGGQAVRLIAETCSFWSSRRRVRASKCKFFQKRFDTRRRFVYKRGFWLLLHGPIE